MKARIHIITATMGLLTRVGGSEIAAGSVEIRVHVPFDFTAGAAIMGAGTCTVQRLHGSQGVLVIRGVNNGVLLLAQGAAPAVAGTSTRLVFHRYGSQYFLRRVWFLGTGGYDLPQVPGEREAASCTGKVVTGPIVITIVAALC